MSWCVRWNRKAAGDTLPKAVLRCLENEQKNCFNEKIGRHFQGQKLKPAKVASVYLFFG